MALSTARRPCATFGPADLDWSGLDFTAAKFAALTAIDRAQWRQELKLHDELPTKLDYHLPQELRNRYLKLKQALE